MGEAFSSGTRRRGPDPFTDLDPRHHIKKILAKDCGEDCGKDCGKDIVDEWTAVEPPQIRGSQCSNRNGFPATSSASQSIESSDQARVSI
jgi:hypothetical protein